MSNEFKEIIQKASDVMENPKVYSKPTVPKAINTPEMQPAALYYGTFKKH